MKWDLYAPWVKKPKNFPFGGKVWIFQMHFISLIVFASSVNFSQASDTFREEPSSSIHLFKQNFQDTPFSGQNFNSPFFGKTFGGLISENSLIETSSGLYQETVTLDEEVAEYIQFFRGNFRKIISEHDFNQFRKSYRKNIFKIL
jgi:hypothetical protein